MSTENVDRGDNFAPTTPDTSAADAAAAEAARVAAEVAAAEADAAAKAAAAKADEGTKTEDEGEGTKAEAPRDDKGRFIPKGRFDEAVSKEREAREAAERKVQELTQQLASTAKALDVEKLEGEIVDLEKARDRAIIDGDADKATQLSTQIRLKEREVNLAQSQNLSATARAQASEEIRVETAIATLESTYEVLNPKSEKFDQDIVDMVLATQGALINNERMSPSMALAKAAEKVMAKIMPPSKQDEPSGKPGLAAGAKNERTTQQVAKNIETAAKQPPSTKDVGMDSDMAGMKSDKIDVTKLTQAEFNALPEATKSRLRGDTL